MASTYTPIATTSLGSAQSSVTFSSISGYTDLVVIMNAATTHSLATFTYLQFNSDTGTNYSYTDLDGNGTSIYSNRGTSLTTGWITPSYGSISQTLGDNSLILNVMNYSNSTTYKTYLAKGGRAGSSLDYQGITGIVGLWRNTSAITSVTLKNSRGGTDYNFASGSTFTVYGIKAA